jgi:hypothetical protein
LGSAIYIVSTGNTANITSNSKYDACIKAHKCQFEGEDESDLPDEKWYELIRCKLDRAKNCNKESYETNTKPNTHK